MTEPLIDVQHVGVFRGERQVLRDVSLQVAAGTRVALAGPNGSGKSTLVAAICGDIPVAAGGIRVAGRPVETADTKDMARVRAVMTQHTAVAFGFTVREVVTMGRSPWVTRGRGAADMDEDARIVEQAIADMELTHLTDRPVQALSGGELARVAMARTLAQTTPVIILDEPTASLDLKHQVLLLRQVQRRAAAGAAALIVMHDPSLAAACADVIALLSEGRIAAIGPPAEVLTAGTLAEVYGIGVTVLSNPTTGLPVVTPIATD